MSLVIEPTPKPKRKQPRTSSCAARSEKPEATPIVGAPDEFADRTVTSAELNDVFVAEGYKLTPRYDRALKAWRAGQPV